MPVMAQDVVITAAAADEDPLDDGDAIVVVAERLRGQVDSAQPPILELDEQQIAGYGAGSIADLVEALSSQTGSGSGRSSGPPVFLVNGMRVSSFREMRSYPPEAIQKVEILAEEVALKYGYSGDRRVMNFILKDKFSSREIEVEYGQPWAGGNSDKEIEATYLRIDGPSRLNINAEWNGTSLLTEAERGIIQSSPVLPGAPDPGQARSLISDSSDMELTANWTTKLAENGSSLSLNGTYERGKSLSLSGLSDIGDPLEQRRLTQAFSFGSTLNAPLGDWQLTGTIDAARTTTDSEIDRQIGNLYDDARSVSTSANSLVTVMGSPLFLPAGDVSLTFDTGYSWNRSESTDTRNPGLVTELTRGNLSAGANLSIPIASRREEALSFLGDLTLNLTGGVDHLSDFGTLTDWSAGLTWGLTEKLSLQATYTARDAAPSLSQLGAPEIVTLNVPIYDLARGETVDVSIISGGNDLLEKQKQRDIRIAATWELPFLERSNFMVEYFRNTSDDVSAAFPLLTPAIEAAFPDRVTRDINGQLVSIDQRPITFAEQNSSRLKFGLNLSGQLGKANAEAQNSGPWGGMAGGAGAPGAPNSGAAAGGERPAGAPDPARFAEMREKLCAEGAEPDLSTMPEQMQAQLRGEDGKIDPAKLAQFKTRICSADFVPGQRGQGQGAPGQGAPAQGNLAGGPPPGGPGGRGPGGGGFRGPGGPGGPGGGDGRGRWFANMSYTLELENEVLIAQGLPVLDLLDGGALSGGGVSRHSADLSGGLFYRGFGSFLNARYSGSSRIDGTGLPGSTDLEFGSLTTFNLRVFADLGQQPKLVESVPFFKGSRISLGVQNIFDSYRTVTDSNGDVPLRYQPGFLDPEGRSFSIEFRKLF